jgi:DNA-binding transcriptional LysR family regulator
MKRAQSAVTYGVQGLEQQIGTDLFDRSSYRPTLTPAGVALLPRARRVLEAAATFRTQALNLTVGIETRLALVVDVYVPHALLVDALKAFHEEFPLIDVSVMRQPMEATIKSLRSGQANLGVVVDPPGLTLLEEFQRVVCGEVSGVTVAAPAHPLARIPGPIGQEQLRDHMQILLSSDPAATGTTDLGAHAVNRWRVNDLEVRYRMILEGLGWGTMPAHMVADDIEAGRLAALPLDVQDPENRSLKVPLSVAHLKTKPLGPAGRWLVGRLREASLPD